MEETVWSIVAWLGIPTLVSGIPTIVYRWSWKKVKKKLEDYKAVELGMRSLLRDRIVQAYNHSVHHRGYCPIYEKENVTNMYEQYHNLGGNGTITELYEELMELPTQPKGEH